MSCSTVGTPPHRHMTPECREDTDYRGCPSSRKLEATQRSSAPECISRGCRQPATEHLIAFLNPHTGQHYTVGYCRGCAVL